MNNFGVVEIATAKTTSAPGWAYVPERQRPLNIPATGTTTTNRKRPRNAAVAAGAGATLSLADANARQEAKARREIEILDRDNSRDVQIAVPTRPRGHAKRASNVTSKKSTSNVRRILQSQKTFANHLDDYLALESSTTANTTNTTTNNNNTQARGGTPVAAETRRTSTITTIGGGGGGQRLRQTSISAAPSSSSSRRSQQHQPPPSTAMKQEKQQEQEDIDNDIQMQDAPPSSTSIQQKPQSEILTPYTSAPPFHPEDNNPLLASRLPPIPSDEELRALLAAPPLTYLEARGTWQNESRYPPREFCAICGYWGRVRCMKCGTRVCALDCLETHREECITRYGL
jgi:zinc finger HIT domain-containing protein 1